MAGFEQWRVNLLSMRNLRIRIVWGIWLLAMTWLLAHAAPDSLTNAAPDSNTPQKRPRSLREARERNGVATSTNLVGVQLWDNHGRKLADPDYEKKLLEVFLANVNRLVDAGLEGGSGVPTEGLSVWIGFRLNPKGELSNVRVLKTELPETQTTLATRALDLSSPLAPWSPHLLEAAEGRDLELQIALSSGLIHRKSKR